MADKPTAADYLADAQRKATINLQGQRPVADTAGIAPFNISSQARQGPQDALSWVVDILTRPLSGVTNTVQTQVNRSANQQKALQQGDVGGVLGSIGEGLLDAVLPARHFLSGMFSTDPEQHRTFSDVIEQSTDAFGSLDPKYVNVQDNVNPVLKGGAGLVLDIAGDPLTWIPGAQIAKAGSLFAKGAKLGITGAKGALDALSGASSAAKIVDDAVAVAGAQAAKTTRPTATEVTEHAASRIERAGADDLSRGDPEFQRIYQEHLDAISGLSDDAFERALDTRIQGVVAREIERSARSTAGKQLQEGLDSLGPMTIRDIKRVPGVTAKSAKPVPLRTMAETRGPDGAPVPGWVDQVAATPVEQLDFFGKNAQAVKNMAMQAIQGNKRALGEIEKLYVREYLPRFASAKSQGKIMGANFREMKPTKARVIEGPETVLDSLANFRAQLAKNADAVTARFGKPLTQALARFDNAANFDKAVSRLKGILDQSIDVTTLRRLTPPDVAALERLGIRADAIPTGLKPQAAANKEPLAEGNLAEQVAKMGDGGAEQADAVRFAQAALERTIFRDLDRANLAKEYPLQTKTGTLRTEDQYGAGWGRNHREANTFFQYNLSRTLTEEVGSWITRNYGKTVGGRARAEIMSTQLRQAMRLAERALDQQGVPLTIGVGPKRIPLSTSQILDALDRIDHPTTLWAFYNADTAMPWTNLSDAVYSALSGGTREHIEAMLRQTSTRHIAADGRPKPLPNNMIQGGGRYGRGPALKSDDMIRQLTDLIDRSRPLFNQIVAENAQALGARGIDETFDIVDNVLSNLEQLKATPGAMGSLLEEIADTSTRVTQIAKDFGMMKASRDMGEAVIDSTVPLTDQVLAQGATKVDDLLRNIEAAEEAHQATVKVTQRTYEDLLENDPFITGGNVTDLGLKVDQVVGRGILGKVLPIFSRRAGAERVYPNWMRSENIFRTLVSRYHTRLSALARTGLEREDLANRLVNARNGVPTTDPVVTELRDLWGQMFGNGTRAGTLIDNAFFRNGNNIHHLNQMFERDGLADFVFDVEKAQSVSKAEGISVMEAAARQAAEWEIKDPLDTLSRMYQSFVSMQTHQTLAQQFTKMAKDLGATSRAPQAGYSLVGNDSGRSIFAKYLPDNLYFRDDVLHEMQVVDNLIQQTMDLSGPLGTFVREVYQPLQQAWKYGMTLPNPTHHIRNLISDYSLTYYANGIKGARRANTAAFQAMAAHDGYDGWSAVKALQGMETLPNAGHVVAKGALGEITADGLYSALSNRGNLMTFQHLEQLNAPITKGVLGPEDAEMVGRGPLAQLWENVHGSSLAHKIGGVSEARDHFSRLQHAAQFIIQNIDNTKAYKSLDELLDAASDATRKWHPDGTDMTRAEQYFRLLIPFYSWQRKAIPLIIESMLTHPGRVMSIPKAQYNLAVAMGVNPDSLSDPFPQDQLFPSYMTEDISGPIAEIDGNYYGINPGFAANDVLNQWVGGNPLRSLLGSTSPLIRSPFEIAAGGQVGTGARINDYSDYIDSQTPGLSQISRMTGNSVTGSLVSMLQGQGLDPQYQIAQGNKDPLAGPALSALNWLTGAGITNMSLPNAINYAEIEKRNREGKQDAGF